jgi:hypothetical protein
MPTYICEICNFTSKLKGNYKQHIESKKHRVKTGELSTQNVIYSVGNTMSQNEPIMSQNEPKTNETIIYKQIPQESDNEFLKNEIYKLKSKIEEQEKEKKKFVCENCGTGFSSKASKRRHQLHRCKEKNKFDNLIEEMETKHEVEKKVLHNKIDQLIEKVGNRTTNITNNTQNIILKGYGNEDMSHITDGIKNSLLKIPFAMIPKMIEAVHFNDDKPENKNILLPNKKDNLVKIFNGDKWIHLNKDDVIRSLVSEKYIILDKHFEDKSKTEIEEFVKENYVKFRDIYSKDKMLIEKIQNDCELVLLNNR